ncbi:hypothetical protein M1P56_32540 [Streptomyces sp. HU2014]|uniref:hypothetical protein n=1 Tax=Streptomyces sp. HU2014 TaxID=2939414 RepID=UPI00200E434C|nr:hypothetical protein [Streptomyces sp. HU2014]UQI48708.1 hypothetical protein M1P56_32540 [Streptomyces sp. HU2014]
MSNRARVRTHACQYCGGFATVGVTSGTRHPDGSRVVVFADCPACGGRGDLSRSLRAQLRPDLDKAGAAC